MVGLAWWVWFGRFDLAGLVWQVWFGRFGLQNLQSQAANSLQHLTKLATAVTAVTAVKAGDNELTFVDGIKYLSNVDIEMKLRFSCQQLKTSGKACKAGNSCNSCQSWRQ